MTKPNLFFSSSRREFAKNTLTVAGLGALGAGLNPHTASRSGLGENDEKKLGVALVGLGYYATHKLAVGLEETKYCKLTGIVTGTPSKIPEWKKKYDIGDADIYSYETFDQMAGNPNIDIVYIVLPNAMHAEYVVRAAKAGKHVICEKPFDINAKRCEEAVEACKKAGKLLQIGYRCQYDPHHMELMKIGLERSLGQIKEIRSAHSFFGVHGNNWRYTDRSLAGGGPLMDVGIYSINAARYCTGEEPEAVYARTYNTYNGLMDGMEESIVFTLEFPSGAIANMSSSYVARANYIHISAEKGNYGLEPAFGYNGAEGYAGSEQIRFPKPNQQAVQMDAFARNILDGTPVKASGQEGLNDMYIIDALYKSARKNGKKINL